MVLPPQPAAERGKHHDNSGDDALAVALGELGRLVLPHGLVDFAQQDILLRRAAHGELVGAGLIWGRCEGQAGFPKAVDTIAAGV